MTEILWEKLLPLGRGSGRLFGPGIQSNLKGCTNEYGHFEIWAGPGGEARHEAGKGEDIT